MKLRFLFETAVGLVIIVAVLLFGQAGLSSIALLALFPFVLRIAQIKGDEREMLIHYKAGNLSFGLAILAVVVIYYLQNINVNDFTIESVWMPLTVGSIVLLHGVAGLFVLFKE